MRYEYSTGFDPAKSARAQTFDADVSYKDLTQVCGAIRGKSIPKAISVLNGAISGKFAISYRSHSTGLGHKSELGGKKGRYPKKAAKFMLQMLNNAYANAQTKGLDEKSIVVLHAAAFKQNVYPRYKKYFASGNVLGYGKYAMFSNYSTARVELIVGQDGLKRIPKPTKKQLKVMAKEKAKSKATAAKKDEKTAAKPAAAKTEAPKATPAEAAKKHDQDSKAPAPKEAAASKTG